MAFDLTPKDPNEPIQELAGASLAEVLTQLAEAIAEGQARLDLSSAQVVQELAQTQVDIVPSIRQIIREDGTVEFQQAEPVRVSLLDLGILPTFLAFSEATAEVAMDLKVVENVTQSGNTNKRKSLFAATQSLRTERRLNRDVSVHTKLTAKLVPVPVPARLQPIITVEDQREGGGV
ncbi:MAG: hypothetical protein RIB93_17860 [Coleofasciculus sp. D1-CHI-01]|jgi:hypothetical protein|uniref:hypothetical protein n=1 Tax=unclassified Coleofasciculus TaxID=2692782 RepID=UPI003304628C